MRLTLDRRARRGMLTGASWAILAVAAASPAWAQDEATPPPVTAEETAEAIIVTGSRIARDGFDAPTPVTVVSADAIQAFGASNVAEVLSTLPAFRQSQNSPANTFGQINGNVGANTIDLRGLAPQRTLVLVNGRRFIPSSPQGTVDLNLIPSTMISRTEIVTGGASAAYGSDAVAGVVNLILDTKREGIEGQVQYGISDLGDDRNIQVALSGGTSFAGGRGHIVVAGEYVENGGVGECYTRAFCAEEWSHFTNTGWPNNGLPARLLLPGKRATVTGGGVINAGPLRGTQFLDDGTPVPFEYGDYVSTWAMHGGGQGPATDPFVLGFYMKMPVTSWSLYGHSTYEITDSIQAFFEASYGKVEGHSIGTTVRENNITILRDNAYLPEEIGTRMDDAGISSFVLARASIDFGYPVYSGSNSTTRLVGGLTGELSGGWNWDLFYQYGHNRYEQTMTNLRNQARFPLALDAVEAQDGSIVCRSTLTNPGNGCVPVNLFGQNNWDPAAKDYLYGTGWQTATIQQHVAAANLHGDLFSTWAGTASIAVGAEFRRDSVSGDADEISKINGWHAGNGQQINGHINVVEGYAETVIPLAQSVSWADLLEFNGAIRLTNYSTSGSVLTWKAGLTYAPTDWLKFRATRSRDIRAPNLLELYGSTTAARGRVVNPGDQVQHLPMVLTGGNPDLVPEAANTWTAGVVISPLRNIRLSLDYYDINVNDALSRLGPQTIVDRCAQGATDLCALVTRDTDGIMQEIRNPWLNLNTMMLRGLDAELVARQPIGAQSDLTFRLLGTYTFNYTTVDQVGAIDRAGQTGVQTGGLPGVPRWTLNGNVTYENGPFTLNVEGRYIPSGIVDVTLVGPGDEGYDVSLPNSISENRVDGHFYLNIGGSVDIMNNNGKKLELYGAINNVINSDPPLNVYSGTGTNPFLFDTIGRRYVIGLRFKG